MESVLSLLSFFVTREFEAVHALTCASAQLWMNEIRSSCSVRNLFYQGQFPTVLREFHSLSTNKVFCYLLLSN